MRTHSSPPTRAQKGAPPSEEKLWTWNWSPRTLQPAGDEAHGGAGQGRHQRRKHPGVGEGGSGHPGRGASPGEEAW